MQLLLLTFYQLRLGAVSFGAVCLYNIQMANTSHEIEEDEDEVLEFDGAGGIWPDNIEYFFICLMEEEIKKGNRQTTTLSKNAWNFIAEELKNKYGKNYTRCQMKNKFNSLRSRWKAFSKLIRETGIRYNAQTFRVTATEDAWTRLYKVHKQAKRFRRKGCKYYDKLCTVYSDTTTTRVDGHPSMKSPSVCFSLGSTNSNEHDEDAKKSKKAKTSGTSDSNYRKSNIVQDAVANALMVMGENSEKKRMATPSTPLVSVGDNVDDSRSRLTQDRETALACMNALNALEGIDGASYVKAAKYIHDDPLWRDMFLGMPYERKRDWVLNI